MVPIHSWIQRNIDIYKQTKNLKYLFKEMLVDLLGLSLLQGLKFLWVRIRNLSRYISETVDTSCTLGTFQYIGYSRTSSSPATFQFTGNSRYSSVIRTPGTGFSMTSSASSTFHCNRHSRTFGTFCTFQFTGHSRASSTPGTFQYTGYSKTSGMLCTFKNTGFSKTTGTLCTLGTTYVRVLLLLFHNITGPIKF